MCGLIFLLRSTFLVTKTEFCQWLILLVEMTHEFYHLDFFFRPFSLLFTFFFAINVIYWMKNWSFIFLSQPLYEKKMWDCSTVKALCLPQDAFSTSQAACWSWCCSLLELCAAHHQGQSLDFTNWFPNCGRSVLRCRLLEQPAALTRFSFNYSWLIFHVGTRSKIPREL